MSDGSDAAAYVKRINGIYRSDPPQLQKLLAKGDFIEFSRE